MPRQLDAKKTCGSDTNFTICNFGTTLRQYEVHVKIPKQTLNLPFLERQCPGTSKKGNTSERQCLGTKIATETHGDLPFQLQNWPCAVTIKDSPLGKMYERRHRLLQIAIPLSQCSISRARGVPKRYKKQHWFCKLQFQCSISSAPGVQRRSKTVLILQLAISVQHIKRPRCRTYVYIYIYIYI